ncbi:fumarylacetoacetate hydrolase family protein [Lysobacter sp. K5869]|uniref:fumarylacetoacetate hydrolase family protein n=1 Tax=Lysobacter sp. K5869 TaxID=2820808 RepID=UPI001C0602E5|nr:fumarylacetoacetate hydrolase family protein [Lysobacter sp. K5869]QWP76702.1 fumarylacetoacetate hydrolase family protein [Lysobacter sp. K5869]
MSDVVAAAPATRIPVRGQGLAADAAFPVHRVYCVGRNFADHAREMGAAVPASAVDRGRPTFFLKPTDSLETGEAVPYPPGTDDLHHEVELVVALGSDAPAGPLAVEDAQALVYGYAVGLDLTRRDLQAQAKAKGLPWDTGKSFDHAAPISAIVPAAEVGELGARALTLEVNGEPRQRSTLDNLIWNVPEVLHELSLLYALRAGDLIYMGTPAGVAALRPGDRYRAALEGVAELHGHITPPRL